MIEFELRAEVHEEEAKTTRMGREGYIYTYGIFSALAGRSGS